MSEAESKCGISDGSFEGLVANKGRVARRALEPFVRVAGPCEKIAFMDERRRCPCDR